MPRYRTLDRKTLEMALIGYEAERARIRNLITELQARLGANPDGVRSAPKQRTLSAAARARIAEAQRKRWAAQGPAMEAARPKRKLSAAGRKAIVEATKKRWTAFHKAQAAAARAKARKGSAKAPTTAAAAG